MLSKVGGGWKVERRWTLSREVAFASKVGICSPRVKGIDGVRARMECLGTGIPPRLAYQVDYHGTYLADSRTPLGNGLYLQPGTYYSLPNPHNGGLPSKTTWMQQDARYLRTPYSSRIRSIISKTWAFRLIRSLYEYCLQEAIVRPLLDWLAE